MKARALFVLSLCLILSGAVWHYAQKSQPAQVSLAAAAGPAANNSASPDTLAAKQRVLAGYGDLPLSFEINEGQTDARVKFVSRASGYTMFLTPSEAVLTLRPAQPALRKGPHARRQARKAAATADVVRLKLVGANPAPQVRGLDEQPGRSNYFIGNDPTKWRTNVANYARVEYQNVYPGIDLIYYGNQRQLEHDFVVAPGASPAAITLGLKAASKPRMNAQGDLVLSAKNGELALRRPRVYQKVDGREQTIDAHFALKSEREVGFEVAAYDASRPLVIDPILSYASYDGGTGDDLGNAIAVDSTGAAYITGSTTSVNFPFTVGVVQPAIAGTQDAFVTKFDTTKSGVASRVYSTYLGGVGSDGNGFGIAVDSTFNAYVTGRTDSAAWPLTPASAFQTVFGGGSDDVFLTKLNSTGASLMYSSYLGGNDDDEAFAIAVPATDNAYITGYTCSTLGTFPTTAGVFNRVYSGSCGDVFVAKFDTSKSGVASLAYSTLISGNADDEGSGIAVDSNGNAYITGETTSTNYPTTAGVVQPNPLGLQNAFVTKLNSTATAPLTYSTLLGGTGGNTQGTGIAIDSSGSAYVTGFTSSTTLPTSASAFQKTYGGGTGDAFVAKLNGGATAFTYLSYLGGTNADQGNGIAVDSAGNAATVVGFTQSSVGFPTTPSGIQPGLKGAKDAFVTRVNASGGGLVYSNYLGGTGNEAAAGVALDTSGNAYVVGSTTSADFPGTAGSAQPAYGGGADDAFVAKVVAQPDYSLAIGPTPVVVKAGSAGNTTLTVTALDGSTQAVAIACTGAPAGATCTGNPTSVTLTGSGTATSTITVGTTALMVPRPRVLPPGIALRWLVAAIAGAMLVLLAVLRRRRAWVLAGAATLVLLIAPGCTKNKAASTPPGAYNLTVTATSGATTHTINLPLTVN